VRQLTLIDWQIYSKIKPVECLNKNWSEEDSHAYNIKAMIHLTNRLTVWVVYTILRERRVVNRREVFKYFVQTADKCRQLNNFDTLMAILAGLTSTPIHRLKVTWELMPNKVVTLYNDLRAMMNPTKNFSEYREALHSIEPPCVPFLGVYLTDLTFIEDGNPDRIHDQQYLINFAKRSKTAEVIREIQQYQVAPYILQPVQEIQDFLQEKMNAVKIGIQDLFNLSKKVEPIENDTEKAVRRLREAGFV